jgi:chromate transporter
VDLAAKALAMTGTLATLALLFGHLSLLAIGGVNAILPEMQRQVVEVHNWMSASEFTALFALAQAAPGPNIMVVALVGYYVAGVPGAVVSMTAVAVPPALLMVGALRIWDRYKQAEWRQTVQGALVAVTSGLIAATAILIAQTAVVAPLWAGTLCLIAIAGGSAFLSVRNLFHPLMLLGGGALLGVLLGPLVFG